MGYFSCLAKNINIENEARKVEEEFRLCKSYAMNKNTDPKLICTDKLSAFFHDHFSAKHIELQAEAISPKHYPNIIPPDDLMINSNIYEVSEVKKM